MHVLPLGLGKFGKVLDLQKKGHLLLIVAPMELLPHSPGNFGHDPLSKFDMNLENF